MTLFEQIHQSDLRVFNRFHGYPGRSSIQRIARYISSSADGHMYVVMGLGLIVCGEYGLAQILALAFLVERCTYLGSKNFFKRNRPPQAIVNFRSVITPSDHFSMPSGHTSAAFLMLVFLAHVVPLSLILTIPWAILVGMSRVVLGVHFPSDTVAGALLGSSVCWMSICLIG